MVENRAFTAENLELVNRIEWDGQDMILLALGPERGDVAKICWPTGRNGRIYPKRETTEEAVRLAVEFLEAITGLHFIIKVLEDHDNRVVWFVKEDE